MICVNCGCAAHMMSKGRMMNEVIFLRSQIHTLRENIPQLEKQARKTPPKTLVAERQKVEQAKVSLLKAKEELRQKVSRFHELCAMLGQEPTFWCVKVNAFLTWDAEKDTFVRKVG